MLRRLNFGVAVLCFCAVFAGFAFVRECTHLTRNFSAQYCGEYCFRCVYVIIVMALYERKARHANSENMVIFQDKPLSDDAENIGCRNKKSVALGSRVPFQDRTTAVENTRNQPLRTTKQVVTWCWNSIEYTFYRVTTSGLNSVIIDKLAITSFSISEIGLLRADFI